MYFLLSLSQTPTINIFLKHKNMNYIFYIRYDSVINFYILIYIFIFLYFKLDKHLYLLLKI